MLTIGEPWLSVIIPVYREPERELRSLLSWIDVNDHPSGIEWIISCATGDKSSALVRSLSKSVEASSRDLLPTTTVENLIVIESAAGRATQMNAGARRAKAQLLLFLHADTRLDGNWSKVLYDSSCQGAMWGAFSPEIDRGGIIYRIAEFWGLWRSRALGLPYGDQAIFIRKEQFQKLGGFDEKVQFMEDVDLARRLGRLGISPKLLEVAARTSARRWDRHGLGQSTRNFFALALYLSGAPRSFIRSWYQRG